MSTLEGKSQALLEWAQQWPDIDAVLKLNASVTDSGDISLVIAPSNAPLVEYVDGTEQNSIAFALCAMMPYSSFTDSINANAQKFMERWHDWVRAQDDAGNYPDFGDAVVDSLRPVQATPTVANVYNQDSLAKYQFQAQIIYTE